MYQFLSPDKLDVLTTMFQLKPVSGKYYTPIGLNKLKLSKVEKRETKRKGLYMYVVEFYKPPEEVRYKSTKASYKPIQCFHILTNRKDGKFKTNWYRPFTNNLKESGFEKLKEYEGQFFQCLVKQREEMGSFPDKDRPDVTVRMKLVKCEIVGVYPLDEEVEYNYFDLYERI